MLNYSKKLDRRILIPILIILAIFLLATTMQTSSAATINVNNGTEDGGILEGLNNANDDDTIFLEEGKYTGINNTGLTINKNVTIQGNGPREKVIIDAQNLSKIFVISANTKVILVNMTFINGYGSNGGAISNYGNLFIYNCTFYNNTASNFGGAISNGDIPAITTIYDSIFDSNYAEVRGGSIYGYVDVYNSVFNNNSAGSIGGAIDLINGINRTISNCIFYNNTAPTGGVIRCYGNNLTITNSSFINNSGSNDIIYTSIGVNNTINECNFINNNAKRVIYSYAGGDINIRNSKFYNNTITIGVINIEGNATISENIFSGSDNYIANNGVIYYSSINNIMDSVQTELSIINVGVSFNRVIITVKAVDENGNLIIGKTINFYVNGVLVGNAVTDSDGIAEFSYNVSNYGVQNIVMSLDEFNETFDVENITDFAIRVYSAATNTTSINVAKTNTNVTIIVSNATTGKQTIVSGVLVDENGNPIAGASLNVVIGGKSYSVVTGADGKWELPYTPSKAGNYNAKVYYNGDTNYLASTSSVAYTVAQEEFGIPQVPNIRLVKRNNSKAVRHGNVVYMKWLTFKNFGASGSQTINAKIIIKNLKYKLWKVYNKKLNYKFAKNNIKFKLNLKSNGIFKLKLKVYRPIKQK